MSESARQIPADRKKGAYWQIVALVVAITFVMSFLRFKIVSHEMVSDWLLNSAGLSIGLCIGEAIRRRRG
jgi:hypothetical protein